MFSTTAILFLLLRLATIVVLLYFSIHILTSESSKKEGIARLLVSGGNYWINSHVTGKWEGALAPLASPVIKTFSLRELFQLLFSFSSILRFSAIERSFRSLASANGPLLVTAIKEMQQ